MSELQEANATGNILLICVAACMAVLGLQAGGRAYAPLVFSRAVTNAEMDAPRSSCGTCGCPGWCWPLWSAQQSPVTFLYEPTNHLEIAHVLSTLTLVRDTAQGSGKTVVIVLHDLNMAAMVADRIVMFKAGEVVAEGPVRQILSSTTIETVFDIQCAVITLPDSDLSLVVPLRAMNGSTHD